MANAGVLLAIGSIGAMVLFRLESPILQQKFAICNANRHVGLALLLSDQHVHVKNALPVVACYALAPPLVMVACMKLFPVKKPG